jgi:hypothetical protein
VLTTCQPSTVWCSRERLPAAAAQPAQGSSEPVAPRIYLLIILSRRKQGLIRIDTVLNCVHDTVCNKYLMYAVNSF